MVEYDHFLCRVYCLGFSVSGLGKDDKILMVKTRILSRVSYNFIYARWLAVDLTS